MRIVGLLPIWFVLTSFAHLHAKQTLEDNMLDFWLGEWQLTWEMQDGTTGKGSNTITKILDGKVIQENFAATDAGTMTGFKGTSISVYNPINKSWHQAWADNQGSYYDFKGSVEEGKFMFSTSEKNGFIQRMVFYNVTENQLDWDWGSSKDGGKTWALNWRIHYKKENKFSK